MRPETRLHQLVKRSFPGIIWTRIENTVAAGVPDLLGYNANHYFFTLELKVTKRERIRFSPHQIAFHKLHPKNSFILVQSLSPRRLKLYEGSCIMELDACGLKLDPCASGLEACGLKLSSLGA